MLVNFVHSIKMCFIVYWFLHGHLGGGSFFRMPKWVNLVYPMRSRVKVVSSFLVLSGSTFFSLKMSRTWKSQLWKFSPNNCCHFFVIICLIFCLISVLSIFDFLSGTILRTALANEAALLFPWIPTWLGIQQNIISLQWFMELSFSNARKPYGEWVYVIQEQK